MKYLRENWIAILVAVASSIVVNSYMLGVKATSIDNAIVTNARAIENIKLTSPEQTKWQTDQNAAAIIAIRTSAQITDEKVGQINSKLAGIDVKLDFIKDSLSNNHRQP